VARPSGPGLCDDRGVRPRVHAIAIPSEIGDFADEVRRVYFELGRVFGADSLTGECSPAVDVFETEESIEIAVDLPGVDRTAIRIVCRGDGVLVVGEKVAHRSQTESTFHLVERGYGRFARVIRLTCPTDPSKARATLAGGELRISIPKIEDRRGQTIRIAIT
jgi:HSP20 family protein